jgi:L-ascorbate metabolism protein UlaG (beta-lactamase superfamily)
MLRVTYIGGPTALLQLGGLRLLTDPTFDPGGTEYRTRAQTSIMPAGWYFDELAGSCRPGMGGQSG